MRTRDILRHAAAAVAAAGLLALSGVAQAAYPDQPLKLVVGFPPGGGGDLYGRAIAMALGKTLGQTVVVDNRPGAGGDIGAEFVSRAKPDGYTLILAMSGNMGSSPAVRPNLNYKVPDDFTPIAELVETPYGLMVAADSPIKTIQEYIAAAKSGKLTYASTGTGGAAQIVMEMVKQQANLNILHIPYKGSGPALNDLYGGQVNSFFAPYTPLMGQINGGKLRLLAISTEQRLAAMPQVPTLKEAGIDVVMTQWYGLAGPDGMSKEVVDKLTDGVKAAMQDPQLMNIFRANGARESTLTGPAFRDFIVRDMGNYKAAVKRGNLKAE